MLDVSKVLLPVAFSDRCRGAAQYALALTRHFRSELTLLHVTAPQLMPYGGAGGEVPALLGSTLEELRLEDQERLNAYLFEDLQSLGVRRVSLVGDAAPAIVEYARANGTSIIVMPTHGYGPFRQLLLGSVTAKVLHDAQCPVWTGPHLENAPLREPIAFKTILCAIGAEPWNGGILTWAAEYAAEFGARLIVYHAALSSPLTTQLVDHYFDPVYRAKVAGEARERILAMLGAIPAEADVRIEMRGDLPGAIAEAAVNCDASLTVIGRGRPEAGARLKSGGVYAIIRESHCPVVSV